MSRQPPETMTASEIAAWVYCPEQWRLTAIGHQPANQPTLDRGTARHRELASIERRTRNTSAGSASRRSGCAVAMVQLAAVIGTLTAFWCWIIS